MIKGVYCLTFPNGKKYVGIGMSIRGIEGRWVLYRNFLCHKQPKLLNALKKYGWDNIKKEVILETEDADNAKRSEMYLIDVWNLQDDKYGYNISPGGDKSNLGLKLSGSHRQKIANALKGNKNNLGNKRSEETKRKMSISNTIAQTGKKHSEETKRKMSLSHKKRIENGIYHKGLFKKGLINE